MLHLEGSNSSKHFYGSPVFGGEYAGKVEAVDNQEAFRRDSS